MMMTMMTMTRTKVGSRPSTIINKEPTPKFAPSAAAFGGATATSQTCPVAAWVTRTVTKGVLPWAALSLVPPMGAKPG